MSYGDLIATAAAETSDEAVIISAYIKVAALSRVLLAIPERSTVRVYVRWEPKDIASGASDLSIWELISARPHASLFVCSGLHAKYYRFDDRVFTGSANMTLRGMGWIDHANLEFMRDQAFDAIGDELETRVAEHAIPVTQELVDELLLVQLDKSVSSPTDDSQCALSASSPTLTPQTALIWLPQSRYPESLLQLAQPGQEELMSQASCREAQADLRSLRVPQGLAQVHMRQLIAKRILSQPVFRLLDERAAQSSRFGEVKSEMITLLREHGIERDAARLVQTLYRWAAFFLPDRYEITVSRYSEVIRLRSRGSGR